MTAETRDLVVTRVLDAPVERVWEAWTDSEKVMSWWGPMGFTSPLAEMDVREGGTSLVCMRSPEGQDLFNTWTYRKITPLQEIEFVLHFADKAGTRVDPAELGLPADIPNGVRHVLTFEADGVHRTKMTVTEFGYTSDETLNISRAGLEQSLDKMAESLT